MSFDVSADAYKQFMGRFSGPLAGMFADTVGVAEGQRVLDVGCGAGALTDVLVDRLGVERVCAADPSVPFVDAIRERYPSMDVQLCAAEKLPFPDAAFDLVLAQLVVHFMADPVAGIAQMARTAIPGGVVAANVWDNGGRRGPVDAFWSAVRTLDPSVPDESGHPGVAEGHLAVLFTQAGLNDVTSTALTVSVYHDSFEDWWRPFTLGVGPAGAYVATLDAATRTLVRDACRDALPQRPFATTATAWTVWART
jgi:trans-aconitate methyltransferase